MITISDPIEEETLPHYCYEHYYPVSIGQTFNERYKVLAKLGFGTESTTWLAKDLTRWRFQNNRFVTLQILTKDAKEHGLAFSELALSKVIVEADANHEGLRYLRTVLESFEIQSQYGRHQYLVYMPMRETLSTFQERLENGCIPINLLKPLPRVRLIVLDYFHTECHIIHTDLMPENILLGIEDERIIQELIEEEENNPTPAKICIDRRIYSHSNFGDLKGPPGCPKLGDFGLAVKANQDIYYQPIQPVCLQAPEVILNAGWTYSADTWNLGVMVWDLLEGRSLFQAQDPKTEAYAANMNLAKMISVLGPPPEQLLRRESQVINSLRPEVCGVITYMLKPRFADIVKGDLINAASTKPRYTGLEATITALSGDDKKLSSIYRQNAYMDAGRSCNGQGTAQKPMVTLTSVMIADTMANYTNWMKVRLNNIQTRRFPERVFSLCVRLAYYQRK